MSQPTAAMIGDRRELFVEDTLIDRLTGGATLRPHQPVPREVSLRTDRPWEGNMCGGYKSCFHDGEKFRLYYQAWHGEFETVNGKASLKDAPIRICVAFSDDGVHWMRPSLGLYEFNGSSENNITFMGLGQERVGVHGFSPYLDTRPGCPAHARYKSLGASDVWPYKLYAFQSEDGLRWTQTRAEPVMTEGAFDSQNLAFWDATRGEYRAYIRDFGENWHRGIKTCTSPDFITWTKPRWLTYPGAPVEQLYTNQVMPYPRAPHLFVGFPTRYIERPWSPTIEAMPELEHRKLRANVMERYGAAVTDGLFMASRDGEAFKRWDEAFIRPGPRAKGSWAYGDCYQGWGMIETASDLPDAPPELSFFVSEGYWRGSANAIRRYSLRIDGFVSLHAPLGGGELVTRPIQFQGDQLELNISTSAGGGARIEAQTVEGAPIEGYTLADCVEIIGDSLAFPVRWRERSVASLAGRPIRLRFALRDADVFSYRFTSQVNAK